MIPKIIHQFAPKDVLRWHPVWHPCHTSWKEIYPTFIHILWTEELINNFVKQNFSESYNTFISSPRHIFQIDIAKFMILKHYGGIYADMDCFCYENFHNELQKSCCIVESIPGTKDEKYGTFFIASESNNLFIDVLLEKSLQNLKQVLNFQYEGATEEYAKMVKEVAGPSFLSEQYENFDNKENIQILNHQEYNPVVPFYSEKIKMKHMLSGLWGKEEMDEGVLDNEIYDYLKKHYSKFRSVHLDHFDFRKNYLE
jgi:mannosyltransferase OCH1-like enzyme